MAAHLHSSVNKLRSHTLVDLLIFFRMKVRASNDLVSGTSSILTRAPLPSKERGEIRKIDPSNIICGIFNWISWVIANLRVLSYMALVTSSMGDSGKHRENKKWGLNSTNIPISPLTNKSTCSLDTLHLNGFIAFHIHIGEMGHLVIYDFTNFTPWRIFI